LVVDFPWYIPTVDPENLLHEGALLVSDALTGCLGRRDATALCKPMEY